ncbi:MAG: hypothetical protein IJ124_11005 [Clostridia bacterium]|nr:hypothetical protein [Clostridia bacterium]
MRFQSDRNPWNHFVSLRYPAGIDLYDFSLDDGGWNGIHHSGRDHIRFVSFYAVIVLSLIATGALPTDMIPCFFLDFRHYAGATAIAFVFIYGCACLMGWYLSEKNRKLSWLWFKGITQLRHEKEET